MNDFGLFCVRLEITSDAVVEPHSYSDEQVALVCHDIRSEVSVHSEHPHIEWMIRGEC